MGIREAAAQLTARLVQLAVTDDAIAGDAD
jgi:hypothetical protein